MTKFFKGFGSNESSIYKIIGFLFLLSIFFLPINGFPPYFKKYLGELGAEAGNYFLLPAVLLSLVYFFPKRKFTFPSHRSWILLFLFLILFAASLFMNFNSITESSFKGRGGLEKFVVQFLLLGFEIFSVFAIYNFLKSLSWENVNKLFSRVILFSYILILVYGFFEIISMVWGVEIGLLAMIGKMMHSGSGYAFRARSLFAEPSFIAIYFSFSLPWLISAFEEKKTKLMVVALYIGVLILVYFSFSRAALIMLNFQVLLYLCFHSLKRFNSKFIRHYILLFIIPALFVLVFSKASPTTLLNDNNQNIHKASNSTRKAMQVAGIKMGLENPIVGLGLGQYGFHIKDHIPDWVEDNIEIRSYKSDIVGSPWPPVHGLFARIFAEGGSLGLFIWCSIWLYIFISVYKKYTLKGDNGVENIGIILLVCIPSVSLLGFLVDSFRFPEYWYVLALSWLYLEKS